MTAGTGLLAQKQQGRQCEGLGQVRKPPAQHVLSLNEPGAMTNYICHTIASDGPGQCCPQVLHRLAGHGAAHTWKGRGEYAERQRIREGAL